MERSNSVPNIKKIKKIHITWEIIVYYIVYLEIIKESIEYNDYRFPMTKPQLIIDVFLSNRYTVPKII